MWRIHSYENFRCCWLNMIPDSIVHWNISNLYVKAAIWKYNFKSNMNTTSSQASASLWLKRWLKTTIASNLLSIDEFTSKTWILYQNWSRKFTFWGIRGCFLLPFCQLLNRYKDQKPKCYFLDHSTTVVYSQEKCYFFWP